MEQKIYYEDYELGSTRTTIGRTITEADIVLHAGQTGISSLIIWMPNLQKQQNSGKGSPMEL